MERIVCVSENGYSIEIGNGFPFFLEETTGIHEFSGDVSTVKSAFGVGSKFIGTSTNDREITISGYFKSRNKERIPQRRQLYNVFPLNKKGTLYYYEEDKIYKIDYYVKDVKIQNKFAFDPFQIDLICPSPYFTDLEETIVSLSTWKKLFSFPLEFPEGVGIQFGEKSQNLLAEIENESNIEIGMRIVLTADNTVINPKITNVITNEEFSLNTTMSRGDKIEISTYINNKNIYLIQGGEKNRKNNLLNFGSKFLQIHPGSNVFKFDAEDGIEGLSLEFYYYKSYEAI